MYQYFQGKETVKLDIENDLVQFKKETYTDVVISYFRYDKRWKAENISFEHCTFPKLGLYESKHIKCDFKNCVFIDCYFRYAKFERCDFNGAIFINCNFNNATFINCNFSYATFTDCAIKFDVMKNNLPRQRHNLNRDLCCNLGLECLRMGNDKEYLKYYFEEKNASELHFFKKFYINSSSDDYYKGKYKFWDQIEGLIQFLFSKINRFLWGYGENLLRLTRNIVGVILFFSYLFYRTPIKCIKGAIKWYDYIYLSLCNFFTLSPVSKYSLEYSSYEYLSVIEAGIGVIFIGFFVAAIFRYINRRG